MVNYRRKYHDTFYEADPRHTILHSDINIVRHLFFYLKADNATILCFYDDKTYFGSVYEIETVSVFIEVSGFRDTGQRRARIQFEAFNSQYVFDIRIMENRQGVWEVAIPTEIHSVSRRQFPRLPTPSLFMRFTILYSSIFRERSREQEIDTRFPHFMKEIRSETPSLKLLNYMLTDEMLRLGEDYEIVFYEPGREHTRAEKKIIQTRKPLYIGDTSRVSSYVDELASPYLVNFYSDYQREYAQVGEYEALVGFEEIKKNDSRNFFVSYIYAPLIRYDKVIGHLKVYTTYFSKKFISTENAEWFATITELFNYALTKLHILNTRYSTEAQNTQVINISLGGLLFEMEDQELYQYLIKNRRIVMKIPVGTRELEIHGEIIRNYKKGDSYYMGVLFFKSAPEDMARLESYIFDESRQNILG